jgi:hypothetical protein
MRSKHSLFVALLVMSLALMLPLVAGAQTQNAPEGVTWGDYQVQQSIEFGYRFSNDWQKGNFRTFDNYINLHEGPRLLENTLSMRSISHDAPLFDNLYINTFGFGGDPNNVARVKISKNKWYNFSSAFRRDQNFFDYPQFGNPLNPASTLANTTTMFTVPKSSLNATQTFYAIPQFQDSAHPFEVRRRMSDFDLTLLPQSKVSVRLGYSRNRNTGPSYSSFHEGTDFLLGGGYDNTNITDNTYRVGADFKLLPKTTFSFDQFLDYFKNDTGYNLTNSLGGSSLLLNVYDPSNPSSPVPMNFGLPYYGALNNPCSNFILTSGGLANANCSGLYPTNPVTGLPGYYRYQRGRTTTKSSQLSFVSRAIKNVDLTGRYMYSTSDMTSPFTEDFYGGVTRTQERRWGQAGTSSANAINNSADISATIHLTNKLRVVESFRFVAWRNPVFLSSTEWSMQPNLIVNSSALPGTAGYTPFLLLPIQGSTCVPGMSNPANCLTPAAALTAPQSAFGAHNASTGADYGQTVSAAFLGQNAKWNTVAFEYDFLKSFGARIGYRYGTRRDAEKSGYAVGTEYFYPNPAGVGPTGAVGTAAARRADCATTSGNDMSIAANGVCTVTLADELSGPDVFDVTEHTGLFGLWYRPSHNLRVNGEVEFSNFDHAITRVSTTHQQHYRFRTTWQPSSRATVSVTYNGIENSNPGSWVPALPATGTVGTSPTVVSYVQGYQPNTLDINYKGHSRSLGVSTSFTPTSKLSFDIAYNYNQFAQSNLVCPVYAANTAASTGLAGGVWPNQPVCPLFADQVADPASSIQVIGAANTPNAGKILSGENLANGTFESKNHFVSFFVTYRPTKRVTTLIGYNWSNNNGNMLVMSPWIGVGTPLLNPSNLTSYYGQPNTYGAPGSLQNNYHMPMVSISYEFIKNWSAKAQWNYWAYGENTVSTGTGLSNNFHANAGLVSLRYAF